MGYGLGVLRVLRSEREKVHRWIALTRLAGSSGLAPGVAGGRRVRLCDSIAGNELTQPGWCGVVARHGAGGRRVSGI